MKNLKYFALLLVLLMPNLLKAQSPDIEKDYKARAETLLAEVNNRLTMESNEAFLACKKGEPLNTQACGH